MKATGWQQHSVRGFFAGVVSQASAPGVAKSGDERVYRVADKPSRTGARASPAAKPGDGMTHRSFDREPIEAEIDRVWSLGVDGRCEDHNRASPMRAGAVA
jgi:hypothetical protein